MKTVAEKRAYNQKYHREHRALLLARNKQYLEKNDKELHARRRLAQQKRADEFMEWKQAIGCIQCGYNAHGAALDFHHRDANEKTCQITSANWRNAKGQAEMINCELLCANCHRIETCQERRRNPVRWRDRKARQE